jgi:hypothetical protein
MGEALEIETEAPRMAVVTVTNEHTSRNELTEAFAYGAFGHAERLH